MALIDVFSKRNKPLPDVFVYDTLPEKLRVQIVHLLKDDLDLGGGRDSWEDIAKAIAREHGLLGLPTKQHFVSVYNPHDYMTDCLNYVLQADSGQALDLVEFAIRFAEGLHRRQRHLKSPASAIDELNQRFRENGCGYVYENHALVRVDSQVLHADVVKPALSLLSDKAFAGPNKEFMTAHEHFRHGRVEEACTEACKAFESTMKTICELRHLTYDRNATASALIKALVDGGLIQGYAEEQLSNLQKCLIGVATVRNKNSGHGAGAVPRDLPDHFAGYALHLAASNIVFLIRCHEATK